MSVTWGGVKAIVQRLVARAVTGPGWLATAIKTASLSVGEALATLFKMGVAEDLRRLKEDGLRRSKTKTDAEEAKTRELVAKAVEAENKANLVNRNDRISRAEEAMKLAEAAKTSAEAQALLLKAETERSTARAEAFARLLEATTKLKDMGGRLAVNPDGLSKFLGLDDLNALDDGPSQSQKKPLSEPKAPKNPGRKTTPPKATPKKKRKGQ